MASSPLLPSRPQPQQSRQSQQQSAGFDMQFMRRLVRLLRLASGQGCPQMGKSEPAIKPSRVTLLLLVLLVSLCALQTYVVSLTGSVIGGFYQAITDRSSDDFMDVLWLALSVVSLSAVMKALVDFVQGSLSWRWRRDLCVHLQMRYFVNALFYQVVSFRGDCDNPDQRITQDVDKWSQALGIVMAGIVSAPLVTCFYFYTTLVLVGWYAPLFITAYFLIGYIVSKVIMGSVSNLVFKQEQLEGDFRFAHVRVRTCAESIALYGGADNEREYTGWRLALVLRNQLKLLLWRLLLDTTSNLFTYGGSVLNYFVVGLGVFFLPELASNEAANPDPDFVGRASFACIMLVQGYSQLLNVAVSTSDLAGYTARVASLAESIESLAVEREVSAGRSRNNNNNADDDPDGSDDVNGLGLSSRDTLLPRPPGEKIALVVEDDAEQRGTGVVREGDEISFNRVSCYSPAGVCLVRNLSFRVQPGQNMLVVGPSGTGKSSMLRILNGLWPFTSGEVTKPFETLFYLPQDPYLFYGTLRQQIAYPSDPEESGLTDDLLHDLVVTVGLSNLLHSSEESPTFWPDRLSPGEQQLVQFARLFYRSPRFAVLDEATSSLDEGAEQAMYEECARRGITLLSVGHRSTLRRYHQQLLELGSAGVTDDSFDSSDEDEDEKRWKISRSIRSSSWNLTGI